MWTAVGVLTAIALVIVGLLAIRRPAWVAGFLLVMFSLEQMLQSFFPILAVNSWLINVSIGVMALLAVVLRALRGEDVTTAYLNPVLLLVTSLYIYQVLGWSWAADPTTPMNVMKTTFTYIGLYLFIAPLLVRDLRDFDSMMRFVLVFGTIILMLILANPYTDFSRARYVLEVGQFGEAGNPLATGRAGGTIAIAAVLLRSSRKTTIFNAIRLAAFITGMAMAILSGSRGQAFGAGLVVILMYPLARKVDNVKQFFFVAGGLVFVTLAVYFTFDIFISDQNVNRFTVGVNEAIEGRWGRITVMLNEFIDRPGRWIIGLGPGGFAALTGLKYTHNVPVEVLVELGLIGAAIFGSTLIIIVRHWRVLHKGLSINADLRATAALVMGIFLYNLILSCKQGSIISAPGPILYFILIGRVTYTFVVTRKISLDSDEVYSLEDEQDELDEQWESEQWSESGDYAEFGDFSDYGGEDSVPAT